MIPQYPAEQAAQAIRGRLQDAPRCTPSVPAALAELEKRIHEAHTVVTDIEGAVQRIAAPQPREVGKAVAVDPPSTIEQVIHQMHGSLVALTTRLHEVREDLNRAV